MIEIQPAADRFETTHSGITTRHCFSSGAHYDPDNVNFGALIAVDEHVVAPGRGFDRHGHRGVNILSWVLDGRLRHEDCAGAATSVVPGQVLVQLTGAGIEHAERNDSDREPLRFVQMSFIAQADEPRYEVGVPPLKIFGAVFNVLHPHLPTDIPAAAFVHLYVARGSARIDDRAVACGDSVRLRDEGARVEGDAELLVLTPPPPVGV